MSDKYILENKIPVPCDDLYKWAMWIDKRENKIVKQTHIDNILISTVFLGLEHQWGNGKPQLFETMIFGGEHDEYCERYSTWEQAEVGHHKACAMVLE